MFPLFIPKKQERERERERVHFYVTKNIISRIIIIMPALRAYIYWWYSITLKFWMMLGKTISHSISRDSFMSTASVFFFFVFLFRLCFMKECQSNGIKIFSYDINLCFILNIQLLFIFSSPPARRLKLLIEDGKYYWF